MSRHRSPLTVVWLRGLLSRRGARLGGVCLGVAVTVGLLGSLGAFLGSAKASMTARSISRVAVDWQLELLPGTDLARARRIALAEPRVRQALPVGFATVAGLSSVTPDGTTLTTGAARVVGLPDDYVRTFPAELRPLVGSGAGVLVAQQTASNLHAVVGGTVTIALSGLAPAALRVDGVVDLPQADSLFQTVGAPSGAQPTAPPDNVVIVPLSTWHSLFDPLAAVGGAGSVRQQLHIATDRRLPADPAAAYDATIAAAHHLEVALSGDGRVGDNLAAVLDGARGDAGYAQVLFLFLGAPGAVLAAWLTAVVAASGAAARRRDTALLRARGATGTRLLRLAGVEALLVGLLGSLAGVGLAVASRLALPRSGASASPLRWYLAAAVLGLVVAALAVLGPAMRDVRAATVSAGRRTLGRQGTRPPLWQRLGVDLVLLAGSALAFWAASSNGYQLVIAPEGVATLSVNYWAFAAPALLWLGGALLLRRLADLTLRRGQRAVTALSRPLAGPLAGTVAAALGRQRALVGGTAVALALAGAFAGSTATFDATYRQQSRADALLTNGADVTVSVPPGAVLAPDLGSRLARVPGVRRVEPVQHRLAYVGADLQDLFGVRPASIGSATALQDAYFRGASARVLLGRLAADPSGILVSEETVRDYQLVPGERFRLRLPGPTGALVSVPFTYRGVVKEFPTAPKDSFFVTNAEYVASATGRPSVEQYLISASGSPGAVAARIRTAIGPGPVVSDIDSSRAVVGSSLTAVDLRGLSRVELGYALLLALAAGGLLLALTFADRRRMLLLGRLLGARSRQLGGFVWVEAALVAAGGLIGAALLGTAVTRMLVTVLTGVFDPAPSALSVPWAYLAEVTATALAALVIAGLGTLRAAARAPLTLLREG